MDWGGANSRFLGLVSVGAARSLDQTALRSPVIKRIRHIDVKYILHPTCNILMVCCDMYKRSCHVPCNINVIIALTYYVCCVYLCVILLIM